MNSSDKLAFGRLAGYSMPSGTYNVANVECVSVRGNASDYEIPTN